MDGEEDFLDMRLVVERGMVVGMVLNYTAVIDEEETVVCRYDTCHGHLHLHRYWIRNGAPLDLEDSSRPAGDYAHQVKLAENDLREHWRAYRAQMQLKK